MTHSLGYDVNATEVAQWLEETGETGVQLHVVDEAQVQRFHIWKANRQYSYVQLGEEALDSRFAAQQAAEKQLKEKFPAQQTEDFTSALHYGDGVPPVPDSTVITSLICVKHGENDGENWEWLVAFASGRTYKLTAGCDYTGWGCQDWGEWEQFHAVNAGV